MSEFLINVQNSAGTSRGSVTPDIGFNYTDDLNDVNEATMTFSSLTSNDRSLLAIGNLVEIQRNGVVEFFGFIDSVANTVGGGMQVHASGHEIWLAKENGSYSNSPWNDTATEDIFDDLIGDSSYLVLGTTDNAFDFDFRANQSQSIMENIKNLLAKTGQDFEIDYTTLNYGTATTYGITMNITDAKGSTTSVATFSQGINIRNLLSKQSYPRANKILVYGKGDGENQITGSDSDATSISTYGEITKTIVDRTVMTTREANKLAEKTLPLYKDLQKYFFFDMIDPNVDLESGDVATLQSPEHDLSDESVRIVGIDRGINNGQEYLKLEVSDTVSNKRLQKRNKYMAKLEEQARENSSYKQGSGNTLQFTNQSNADNTTPFVMTFNVPEALVQDEAGDLRINSFTISYDVDKYKKEVGGASFDGSDPQVQNTSGSDAPSVSGTSGSTVLRNTFVSSKSKENDSSASPTFTYIKCRAPIVPSSTIDVASVDIQLTTENSTGSGTVSWEVYNEDAAATVFTGSTSVSGNVHIADSHPTSDSSINVGDGDWLSLKITGLNPGANIERGSITIVLQKNHNHLAGSLAAANHSHTDGSYDIDNNDIDDISIGDSIAEIGTLNATSINIYLDYWNGSSWTSKHSILSTGSTLDYDVDLSNSGTYPDAAGLWRVRILTNNSSPDLVKAIVNIKHSLEN